MQVKARLIYTLCYQDGPEHWSQGYATVDVKFDVPETIKGRPLNDWSYTGLEFDPENKRGDE